MCHAHTVHSSSCGGIVVGHIIRVSQKYVCLCVLYVCFFSRESFVDAVL